MQSPELENLLREHADWLDESTAPVTFDEVRDASGTHILPIEPASRGAMSRPRPSGWMYGLAAASATLMLIGGVALLSGGPSTDRSPATQPTPTTIPATTPPGTAVSGAESSTALQPEPTTTAPAPVSTATTMVVVLEQGKSMSDEEIRRYFDGDDRGGWTPGFEVGTIPPRIKGEIIFGQLGDGPGVFDWDHLRGKPTVVLLWDIWPGLLDIEKQDCCLNLYAFQETYDTLADELNFVSVVEDAQVAVTVMEREGLTFPVLASSGSIPWTWPEGWAWVLLDDEGRYLDMFFAWSHARSGTAAWALPVNFLLESLENVPEVGSPAPDTPTSSG